MTKAPPKSNLTFAIIKPDAVRKDLNVEILRRLVIAGFKLHLMNYVQMTRAQAEGFYAVHRERPFFEPLVEFMTSGTSIVMVLEKENAVLALRDLMGATDPAKADAGTLRHDFGNPEVIRENAIHGSDSEENALSEMRFFFGDGALREAFGQEFLPE